MATRLRIAKLSQEQVAMLPAQRDKWLAVGLTTAPADRVAAVAGANRAYAAAGFAEPAIVVWLGSPMAGVIGASMLCALRSSAPAQVRDQVGAQKICFGQHDAEWLSFYDYFRIVCGIAVIDNLSGHFNIAQCCGWWWPYQGVVLLTERPIALHRDRMGRLHNANSLAIEYGDGWGVYAIHGVRVPGKYIETHSSKIDPAEVLKESNAQIRMAVISKIGFAQMLGKLPHKIISRAVNPRLRERNNELIEFALGNGMQVRGLHLFWKENSGEEKETVIPVWRTKEQFGEDTPDDINDCEAVRRWVMGLPKEAVIVEEI